MNDLEVAMKLFSPMRGAYPTMITPYLPDGSVDYAAVRALTNWYFLQGCNGIFASCQSSEISYLSLTDRVNIAKTVVEENHRLTDAYPQRAPMTIVASGHISYDFEEQVTELNAMAKTGIDALVLISNRMDISNTSDEAWIADTERLLARLPEPMPLGIYECPLPYKRLMSDKMLQYCAGTGRFAIMKDTCCDAALINHRIQLIGEAPLKIFNANAQTLLQTLHGGAAGYCGIMCNFHPKIIAWLCQNYKTEPQKADLVQAFLGTAAFTETLAYPATAKYHLKELEALPLNSLFSRSIDFRALKEYDRSSIRQMKLLADAMTKILEE